MTVTADTTITLTERQHEILYYLSYGLSYPEIAPLVFLTDHTVKSHSRRLFAALGVNDRAHAVRVGFELGFLKPYQPSSVMLEPGDERHTAACYASADCPCRKAVAS